MYIKSVNLAPNAGYASAINALQILGVTLGSLALFNSELTLAKGFGLLLAIISIVLLAL